jgi:hypothetical protein
MGPIIAQGHPHVKALHLEGLAHPQQWYLTGYNLRE